MTVELTARQRQALECLDEFCAQRKTGTVIFHVNGGVCSAADMILALRIDATEVPALIRSFGKAKEINIIKEPGSSVARLRIVERKQFEVAGP